MCCFLHVSRNTLCLRIVRVHEHGDHVDLGNQLGKQLVTIDEQNYWRKKPLD